MGAVTQTVASLLGESQVIDLAEAADVLKQSVKSAIAPSHLPESIVYPKTCAQLAEVVKCAHQNQWRLLPCGHGSKLSWGGIVSGADLIVSTQHLNRVIEHAVGDLTVTVEAGVPFAELQASLIKTQQFLAIDPTYAEQSTLGGIVATRDTGALRQRYGGIRDMLIGLSFIRYDGQQAKAGGRVVKNVAGYDLMKLMTGSFGTLGILTELTFRTYSLQAASKTVLLTGDADTVEALVAEVRLSSLTPAAMDLLSPATMSEGDGRSYGLALQFQSSEAGIVEQIDLLNAIAANHPLTHQTLTDAADTQFWQQLATQLYPASAHPAAVIAKIGTAPASGVALLKHLQTVLAPNTWQARIHASSGIGVLRLMANQNAPESLKSARSHCQATGGYLNLLEAPQTWKTAIDPWALAPSTKLLMNRLRNQFDPQQKLSPGRFS